MQDRLGLHSLARGDLVEYTQTEEGEAPPQACVYGVVTAEPVADDPQIRRIVVLYDITANTFFLGTWPAWRRMPKTLLSDEEFEVDNDDHVAMCEREVVEKMLASFTISDTMKGIGTRFQVCACLRVLRG